MNKIRLHGTKEKVKEMLLRFKNRKEFEIVYVSKFYRVYVKVNL